MLQVCAPPAAMATTPAPGKVRKVSPQHLTFVASSAQVWLSPALTAVTPAVETQAPFWQIAPPRQFRSGPQPPPGPHC